MGIQYKKTCYHQLSECQETQSSMIKAYMEGAARLGDGGVHRTLSLPREEEKQGILTREKELKLDHLG